MAIEIGDAVAILGGSDPAARKPLIAERQRQLAKQRSPQEDPDDAAP